MKVKQDTGLTFDIENEGVSTIKQENLNYYTDTFEPGQTKQRLKVGREVEGGTSGGWNGEATTPLNMNNFPIQNSGTIILPSGQYFGVQEGSGLVLDGTFNKIYFRASSQSWVADDSNGTYELYQPGGGGGGWVGFAESNLDMNDYDILNAGDINTNGSSLVECNGKLKIPVGINLY